MEWLIVAVVAVAALVLGGLWLRTRARVERAETERYAAEQAADNAKRELERLTEQLAALKHIATDAVLVIGSDRTLQKINSAGQTLFGSKAAVGQSVMTATRSVELDDFVQHVLEGGEDDDRQITLNGLPHRARAARAGAHGLVLILRDLSELQRLGRARRDFIANISHELRTPLTSIRLLTESVLAGTTSDAGATLTKINTEVQALEQMAQELLDLAQIESGQVLVRLLPTPVEQIVLEAVQRLQPQAEHKHQHLRIETSADLIALADADKISRALGNLLHNAIKFTPPEGSVMVRAQASNGDVQISVSDTGPGIARADLPRVFERFYRGDRSRTTHGTGLGLAIAKHVVEAHGGKIWVESTGISGQGTTFVFTLLAHEAGSNPAG
jgi:two-component system phosphate regulon sensor histidine kinase PhoR